MTDISREKLEASILRYRQEILENENDPFNALGFMLSELYSGELDADPWIPVSTPPENDDPVVAKEFYRYKRYKPNSQQFKRGIKARWQRHNGYGWDNSEPPAEWQIATEE